MDLCEPQKPCNSLDTLLILEEHTHTFPDVLHTNAFWPPYFLPSHSLHYDPHQAYFSSMASMANWHKIATVTLTDVPVSIWPQGHDAN